MEGSVTLWMADTYALEKIRHPYQRTYRDDKQARWETDTEYCNNYGKIQKHLKSLGNFLIRHRSTQCLKISTFLKIRIFLLLIFST